MENEASIVASWERAEGFVRFVLNQDYKERNVEVINEVVSDCKVAFFEYAAKGGDLSEQAVGAVMRSQLHSRRGRSSVRLTEGDEKVLKQALAVLYRAERNGQPRPTMEELRNNVYRRCYSDIKSRGFADDTVIRQKMSRRGILAALEWLPELLNLRAEVFLDNPNTPEVAVLQLDAVPDLSNAWEVLLSLLPQDKREAVELTATSGMSRTEVAEITGVDARTVTKLLADLRSLLQSPAVSFALFAPNIDDLVTIPPLDDMEYLAELARSLSDV